MSVRQRKREEKSQRQTKTKVEKKKESDQLWKVLLAFVCIIGLATLAIYFVSENKQLQPKAEESSNNKDKTTDKTVEDVTVKEDKTPKTPIEVDTKEGKVDDSHEQETAPKTDTAMNNTVETKKKKPLITNKYDKTILKELKDAEKLLTDRRITMAHQTFDKLVKKHPDSPRAMHGLAKALDELAELKRSNDILKQAVETYGKVGKVKDCPKELRKQAVFRQANRLQFLGNSARAVVVLEELAQSLPNNFELWNKIGVEYLIKGNNAKAKTAFEKALSIRPEDGFALVHIGFILKSEAKYSECIPYFEKGIATREEGTIMAKFYLHYGDAYYRIGKSEESVDVFKKAVGEGLLLSPMQRSLYNAATPLRAKPFWNPVDTPYIESIRMLEKNWKVMRDEGVALYDPKKQAFMQEDEGLREKGDWQQFTMFSQGVKNKKACSKAPRTCQLVETIHNAAKCRRGQIKFSVMKPGTHVWAHCGPTNCRLRGHLGLVIPKDVAIRVHSETRTWEEGKLLIIDDSIEHEVWHNGTSFRMILIIDFWHPDLPDHERKSLSAI